MRSPLGRVSAGGGWRNSADVGEALPPNRHRRRAWIETRGTLCEGGRAQQNGRRISWGARGAAFSRPPLMQPGCGQGDGRAIASEELPRWCRSPAVAPAASLSNRQRAPQAAGELANLPTRSAGGGGDVAKLRTPAGKAPTRQRGSIRAASFFLGWIRGDSLVYCRLARNQRDNRYYYQRSEMRRRKFGTNSSSRGQKGQLFSAAAPDPLPDPRGRLDDRS